jgi:trk system potassium uptake protein TrkA
VKRAIVLINKSEYLPIINSIGLDAAVSVKVTTVDAILRFIRRGHVLSVSTLKEIDAEVMEIVAQEGSQITKKKLKDTGFPDSAIIGAIFRDNEVIIPVGTTQIKPGDQVNVFALPEAIQKVEKIFV